MLSLCVLGSGSSGNSVLVWTDKASVLVDAGLSLKQTRERLAKIGRRVEQVDAIVLTHEHTDHAKHAEKIARASGAQLCVTERLHDSRHRIPARVVHTFDPGAFFQVGDIDVETFRVPHDAIDPIGVAFHKDGMRYTVTLDCGHISTELCYRLMASEVLCIEANHDPDMLWATQRPDFVKDRIAGDRGHLSNQQTAEYLENDWDGGAKVVLMHRSQEANLKGLAELAVKGALSRAGHTDVGVITAEQREPSEVVRL